MIRSFSWGTRQLSRRLNVGKEQGITEEELLTIVEEAQIEGGINEQEGELIRSVIEFDDLEVGDIVTPRVDVVAVADSASAGDILEVFRDSGYSRSLFTKAPLMKWWGSSTRRTSITK